MCSIQNVDIDVKYSRKNFGGHRTTTRLWKQNPLSDPSGHGPATGRPVAGLLFGIFHVCSLNCDLMMGKWFFDKPCKFWIISDVFFWFPRSEMYFDASSGVFLTQNSTMAFFQAKNGISELNLASFVGFCKNVPTNATKMCSGACKHTTHIQTIPKPKGLR